MHEQLVEGTILAYSQLFFDDLFIHAASKLNNFRFKEVLVFKCIFHYHSILVDDWHVQEHDCCQQKGDDDV